MSRYTKLLLGMAAVAGFVLPLAAVDTLPAPPADESCETLKAWTSEMGEDLPASLRELRTYSVAARRAIYNVLPREAQRDLWKEHLTYYQQNDQLSSEQALFMEEAIASLDYSFGSSPEDREVHAAMAERAKALFGFERTRQMFAVLGSTIDSDPPLTESAASAPSAAVGPEKPGCSCSREEDFCNPAGLGCVVPTGGCTGTTGGCGWFWCEPCNGVCSPMGG